MMLFFSGCIVGLLAGIFMTCIWMDQKLDRWENDAYDVFFDDWGDQN